MVMFDHVMQFPEDADCDCVFFLLAEEMVSLTSIWQVWESQSTHSLERVLQQVTTVQEEEQVVITNATSTSNSTSPTHSPPPPPTQSPLLPPLASSSPFPSTTLFPSPLPPLEAPSARTSVVEYDAPVLSPATPAAPPTTVGTC